MLTSRVGTHFSAHESDRGKRGKQTCSSVCGWMCVCRRERQRKREKRKNERKIERAGRQRKSRNQHRMLSMNGKQWSDVMLGLRL